MGESLLPKPFCSIQLYLKLPPDATTYPPLIVTLPAVPLQPPPMPAPDLDEMAHTLPPSMVMLPLVDAPLPLLRPTSAPLLPMPAP